MASMPRILPEIKKTRRDESGDPLGVFFTRTKLHCFADASRETKKELTPSGQKAGKGTSEAA